jgi:hypothetical protein
MEEILAGFIDAFSNNKLTSFALRLILTGRCFEQRGEHSFNHPEMCVQFLVCQRFCIESGEREEAPIASTLECKQIIAMKQPMGTMKREAPALADHGTDWSCSAFVRAIVTLLVEAQAPELEQL